MKKNILMLVTISFVGVICFCCTPVTKKSEQISIAQIKSMKFDTLAIEGLKALSQKTYIVQGYFVDDPVPMILTDLKWHLINRPMPDTVFLPLTGEGVEMMRKKLSEYGGSLIEVKVQINTEKMMNRQYQEIEGICPELPKIVVKPKVDVVWPTLNDLCKKYPFICKPGIFIKGKYALLYSGGVNSYNAHMRYWNDLKFMYNTLKSKYGYSDETIVVVYKDGNPEDSDMIVDFAASPDGLKNAVTSLNSKMALTRLPSLFVFITNHGGGYHEGNGGSEGGLTDLNGDEVDIHQIDETIYYYGQTSNTISDDTLAVRINSIKFTKLIAVLEPCFSGGLIRDLSGRNRIIISAASEFEYSWGGAPGNHDMFSYYFTCAVNSADHSGTAVNADTNNDGVVSILEAFLYAKNNDTASETPFLEDSGDGVGVNNPSTTGPDGVLASSSRL